MGSWLVQLGPRYHNLIRGNTKLTGALGLMITLGADPCLVGVPGALFPGWPAAPAPWAIYWAGAPGAPPAEGVPAGDALSGDLPRASFKEVWEDVGVAWFGDADCCVGWMPRDA